MLEEWWYSTGDKRKGPVTLSTIRQLLFEKKITQDTLVWKEGQSDWMPLSKLQELEQVVRAIPPELPKPSAQEYLISLPLAGPWRRFFARLIDLWVIALSTSYVVAFALSRYSPAFGLWIQRPGSEYTFGWLLLPLVLLFEVGIVAIFGTTLGKALLGVTVTSVDAKRLTVAQYLQRQLGVYWFGLGTGFPLISLFTMALQHGRIKSGRHARYDEGKFNVRASKLSAARALSAAVLVVALFFVNAILLQMSKSSEREYYGGSTWVNPVTGRLIAIPGGWVYQEQKNDQNQVVHSFSGPDYGAYVVFAKEDMPPEMDFNSYLNAWVKAVSGDMRLSLPGQSTFVGTREAVTITGTMVNDRTQLVRATLVKKGRQVWRVVILGKEKDSLTWDSFKLQALLFESID